MTAKKKSVTKSVNKTPPTPSKVIVTNTGKHNVFTEYECLRPGESGECSKEVADMLVNKGFCDVVGQ